MTNLVEPIGPEVSLFPAGYFPDSVRLVSGNYVVSRLLGSFATTVQVFDSTGIAIGSAYSITAAQGYHSLAGLSSGGFVLLYSTNSEARAQIFNASGNPIGSDFLLGSIDYYSGSSVYVSNLASGGFAASWRNSGTTTIRTFDAAGAPVATLSTSIPADGSSQRVVELSNGTLAVLWHEYDSVSPFSGGYPDGYEVSGQLFAANGTPLSAKFIVNQSQAGSHGDPEVTALSGGGFVVTWVVNGQGAGIKAQVYDASGAAIGSNFMVSDLVPGYQSQPDVAALPWGGFLISWTDSSAGNPLNFSEGIRAQLFDSTGERIGQTIQVNNQLYASEVTPSVLIVSDTEARIFYSAGGNANPSGLIVRTIALPTVGTPGNDTLLGASGVDRLAGLGGNDDLQGLAGNDLLDGGSGIDTANYASAGGPVVVDLRLSGAQDTQGAGIDTLVSIEGLIGSDFADSLTGSDGDNLLFGLNGNDTINGLAGNDTLDGGTGANILSGGAGNDRLLIGSGSDGSSIDGGADIDTLAVSGTVSSLAALTGIEAVEFTGGANLTLTGSQFNTGIAAGSTFSGTGTFTINMDAGIGFSSRGYAAAGGSAVAFVVNGTSGTDIIKAGNFVGTLNGGGGSDQITGGANVDTINGGDGNDKIMGFGGADILTGGAGSDTFRFGAATDSGIGPAADQITDFVSGTDKLGFTLIDTDPITPGDQAFDFIGQGSFSASGTAQIRYGSSGGNLLVLADIDGDGIADMEVVLAGLAGQALTGGDFLL
jgi:Ca2+-binding RTX toxin-like protein